MGPTEGRPAGQVIEWFASREIYIDMLTDGFKLGNDMLCYRGCVTWKENGKWMEDDAGCYENWKDAWQQVWNLAAYIYNKRK